MPNLFKAGKAYVFRTENFHMANKMVELFLKTSPTVIPEFILRMLEGSRVSIDPERNIPVGVIYVQIIPGIIEAIPVSSFWCDEVL